ncbi:MAG: hypothetical protein A2286_08385 [Gammaproteobacteria bacterium RIFOXYA12_FULL_61_12]|nr:MAG: hypothetical protein A2514_04565 [Gammaproteobacteria bacterium RIFOXYD12_FULL_61_37]OGT94247.1 MAG: hypothetical protein A2286_08385 [Gammaproteobacteria bacterium RIFOXYA12_FULL_61_12]
MQELLPKLARILDLIGENAGRAASWLVPLSILTVFTLAIIRHTLDLDSAFLQDGLVYLHATLFMLGAAYAPKQGVHARVEILHQGFGPRGRALTDLLGDLLLLVPLALAIIWLGWGYEAETASGAGGLETSIWLKILIPVLGALLLLQGIAGILRNGLLLGGASPADAGERVTSAGEGN